jgi:drug/metabolite transporter (DMT)-like permease
VCGLARRPPGVRGAAMVAATSRAELGPSIVGYMLASAGMSVFNKLAVQAMPLPITLVAVQMAFTVATVLANPAAVRIGSRRDAVRWGGTVPLLFAAMLVSSMFAMEHNTLGTVVVFRNVAPLVTLAIERLFRQPMVVSAETVGALLTILAGVGLYHHHALGLTAVGLAALLLNMAFAVLERLAQRHMMAHDPVDISKPGMMLLNNACGLAPCAALLAWHAEPPRWPAAWAALTAGGGAAVLASCINGLAISYMGLRVQAQVTATTFMVLTNVNKVLVVLFGCVALGDTLTAPALLGVCLSLGGGVWYGFARARAAAAPAPKVGKDTEMADSAPLLDREKDAASAVERPGAQCSAPSQRKVGSTDEV